MTTTTTRPRKHRILEPSEGLLVPDGATGVPKAVAKVAKVARDAFAAWRDMQQQLVDLQAAVEAAPHTDAAADRRALEAGEDMPERTEPRLRADLAEAQRRVIAQERIVRDALIAQAEAIAEHHAEWLESAAAAVEKRVAEITRLAEAQRREFETLHVEGEVLRAVRAFQGVAQDWVINRPADPARTERRREKAEHELEQFTIDRGIKPTVEHLTAAIRRLAEQEAPSAGGVHERAKLAEEEVRDGR